MHDRSDLWLTHPARAPVRRIDYDLTSAEVQVRAIRVLSAMASDHRPVPAELSLAP